MKLSRIQIKTLKILQNKQHRTILFGGSAGSSKSFIGCYWVIKNCLKFEGVRYLVGRARLSNLKQTTLLTLFEVCRMQGLIAGEHYKYNSQTNQIKFYNGSTIFLKDLFAYPNDPEFDSLGGLEITGAFIDEAQQVTSKAVSIVQSRIRWKLDENDLVPKVLMTCNPAKNFLYKDFYIKDKEGKLEPNKIFIKSLVTDNPFISKHYIENLRQLPKAQRDRLLHGMWEVDDDSALIDYENIVNIFSNNFVPIGEHKYITCDVARLGSDKAVITVWLGFRVVEIVEYDISRMNELRDCINALKIKYEITNDKIVVDSDGVGGGLVDILGPGICEFNNNAKAFNGENFQNLKTQCYYKFAELVQDNKIWICAILNDIQEKNIIEELEQIKSLPNDTDGKLKILSKTDVKANIGRSPDYSDALMMRMYFELDGGNGEYFFV